MNKAIYGKSQVLDCNTLAYRKGKGNTKLLEKNRPLKTDSVNLQIVLFTMNIYNTFIYNENILIGKKVRDAAPKQNIQKAETEYLKCNILARVDPRTFTNPGVVNTFRPNMPE